MATVSFASPSDFLAHCGGWLYQRETPHNLLLGIAERLSTMEKLPEGLLLMAVDAPDSAHAALLMTPPFPLVVAGDVRLMAEAVSQLMAQGVSIPAVNGANELAMAFTDAWSRCSGRSQRVHMRQRIHELVTVADIPAAPGTFHRAKEADLEMCVEWGRLMHQEIGLDQNGDTRGEITRIIDAGRLYLWDDGGPVSMAGWGRPTRTGASVFLVYTPDSLRGRGYATSCVAALSRLLLATGRERLSLYTDLADETSNRIYHRIGYQPVCDTLHITFD